MNAHQTVQVDERTMAVAHAANTWGLNFILFALLLDVMVRGLFLDEAAWDLLALVFLAGAISTGYMARHRALAQQFGWRTILVMVITMVVSAIVAAILAMTRVM